MFCFCLTVFDPCRIKYPPGLNGRSCNLWNKALKPLSETHCAVFRDSKITFLCYNSDLSLQTNICILTPVFPHSHARARDPFIDVDSIFSHNSSTAVGVVTNSISPAVEARFDKHHLTVQPLYAIKNEK